jgi:Domain of unknown function (DUF4404)
MNQESLEKTLAALRQELGAGSRLDENSRQRLRELMPDTVRLPAAGSGSDTLHRHRLEELAVEFEVEHPTLAASLRQLVDLLAQAGV